MSGPPRVLRVQSIPPPSARTLDHPVQGGFKWLRRNEGTGVFTSPLAGHPLLDPKMRSILIDWMMEVSVCCHSCPVRPQRAPKPDSVVLQGLPRLPVLQGDLQPCCRRL